MNQTKLISIIVPVYNAEEYLVKCIDSILCQSYRNFELILVNDGSKDSSEAICLKFSNIDRRVVYINQQNSGPSTARNNGIKIAKGDYIQFIDADDYLTPNSVEVMVRAMEDSDFVIASYYKLFKSDQEKEDLVSSKFIGKYFKKELLPKWGELVEEEMFHYTWNKLYKRQFLKNNIKFDEKVKISEDMIFNIDYISKIERINIINTPVYYHVFYNQNSITKRYHTGLFEMRKKTHRYIQAFLNSNNVYSNYNYESVNKLYARRITSLLIHLTSRDNDMSTKNQKKMINTIIYDESVQEILEYFTYDRSERLTAYLISKKRTGSVYYFYRYRRHLHKIYSYIKRVLS